MYAVGDYVVHPGQGVCQVSAVAQGSDGWYTLVPISSKHSIQITFPRTQEGRLRTVMSFDEAEELIDKYPLISLDTFHVHNSSLEESHFKRVIREGSCEDAVSIAKTFRSRIHNARAQNKRPPVSHERIFKMASTRSLYELAVALHTSTDKVKSEFSSRFGIVYCEA